MGNPELHSPDNGLLDLISGSGLDALTVEYVETLFDSMLTDELMKEIPFLGTIVGLSKMAYGVKNLIFTKKMMLFLCGVAEVSQKERQKIIDRLEDEKKGRETAEKALLLLERIDDYSKAKMLAQILLSYGKGDITHAEMLRLWRAVDSLFVQDIPYLKEYDEYLSIEESDGEELEFLYRSQSFVFCGLLIEESASGWGGPVGSKFSFTPLGQLFTELFKYG